MNRVVTKPVFGVSDKVERKPGCTATEHGWRLEISDLGRGLLNYLFSENKGADQLFSHMQKAGFLMTWLKNNNQINTIAFIRFNKYAFTFS